MKLLDRHTGSSGDDPVNVTILASGSKANSAVISSGDHRVLLDCGLGHKKTFERMIQAGIEPESIGAICVTHAHGDHTDGLQGIMSKLNIPIYVTVPTLNAINWSWADGALKVRTFTTDGYFEMCGFKVMAFPVPHDAPCVGFLFRHGGVELAWATDLGAVTPSVESGMDGADIVALEFSHDLDMLAAGPYPPFLKKRISGERGHLDNAAACAALQRITSGTSRVIGIHLSQNANRPDLVRLMAREVLGDRCELMLAGNDGGLS